MTSQKQKALAVAAKISASNPGKKVFTLRDLQRNPSDDVVMESAASPQQEGRQNSALSKVSAPHTDGNTTTHGINQQLHPNILTFSAITGTNARDAERFLEKTNNNVRAAVDLYNSGSVEDQIMELIATESKQAPPRLAAADADAARAKELYDSPSTTVPALPPGSTNEAKLDARSPPQLDADDHNMYSSMGFDGADDRDRPASSGTDCSKTSRSGIQSDETGKQFVPSSVRPNSTVRNEIPIKPGYVPPEDKEVYQIPSRRGSAADTPTQSAVASPVVGDKMDIDSEGGGSGNESVRKKDRWQEPEKQQNGGTETVLKEIRFEPTTEWYKRLQQNGGGWEHILVANTETALKNLMAEKK
jgi:hypothetical protein